MARSTELRPIVNVRSTAGTGTTYVMPDRIRANGGKA